MPGIIRTTVINAALRLSGASQINMQTSVASPISTMVSSVFTSVLRRVLATHPLRNRPGFFPIVFLS